MSDTAIGFAGLGLLLVLIGLRFPIGVSLIGVSFGGIWLLIGERAAWGALGVVPWGFASTWQLSSIPMFLMMGFLCYHADLTAGLFRAARVFLSWLPGGLAVASVFGASGFAAVTGSSVACAAAMGKIAVPEMMRARYDVALATGTVAAAGTIGALIPPSILMILYGIIAQVPVSKLFLGGVGAGLLTLAGYCTVIVLRSAVNPALAPRDATRFGWSERLAALGETWPVILLILGVFGGLFAGVFTPTEAGAVGSALALLIGLAKRSLTWAGLRESVIDTLMNSAALFVIAIGASMLTRFLAYSGAGDALAEALSGATSRPVLLIAGIACVYLLLGMFLEPIGAMLLTLPILLPIVGEAGFDLIWFGILLTKFLEIGMITPPVGLNVFVIKGVVGNLASTGTIFRGILWFLVADFLIVALLVALPDIVLWLPTRME
ncbi:MAG: TRAP transporter large permease [Rhodobacteraceae bacterium]|nr:TRAP transporter large permease [Paracoccaceae bacterium]